MAAALGAQPIQLLALVSLSAIADEIGVRVINRPRLATLAARDRQPLPEEIEQAGEPIRDVACCENDPAVDGPEHCSPSRPVLRRPDGEARG